MINRPSIEDRFTELLDGSLSESESEQLKAQIASDQELARAFLLFKAVVESERLAAQEIHALPEGLEGKIMQGLLAHTKPDHYFGFNVVRRLFMAVRGRLEQFIGDLPGVFRFRPRMVGALASVVCALLILRTCLPGSLVEAPPNKQEVIEVNPSGTDTSVEISSDIGDAAGGKATPEEAEIPTAAEITLESNSEQFTMSDTFSPPIPSARRHQHPDAVLFPDSRGATARHELGLFPGIEPGSYNQTQPNQEVFIDAPSSKRTVVRDNPFSTFSIDVDTASYSNARRFLSGGALPPSDAVRTEEFVNYFAYNYPAQRDKPFSVTYEVAPSPFSKGRHLISIGVRARAPLSERKPWNLVFLVDVSGSMDEPNKLPLVQRSLDLLVDSMQKDDRIGLVTYAGSSAVVLDSTSGAEKPRIQDAIKALSAGGGTNGEGGIRAAYDLATRNFMKDGVNRVILATDGDFNLGIVSHEDLIKLIEDKRRSGVTLTTLGFGSGNLKEGMMEQLADKGNGNFFYIDTFHEARRVLGSKLTSNIEVVAKDVKLQVEFNPKVVEEYRLVGYDNRVLQKQDFNDDTVDAGEIGPDHTVTALYEVVLANSDLAKGLAIESRYQRASQPTPSAATETAQAGEIAFLKVRFKKPHGDVSELLEFPLETAQVRGSVDAASADFRFASVVAAFAELLKGSPYSAGYDFAKIEELAASAVKGSDDPARHEFLELVRSAKGLKR